MGKKQKTCWDPEPGVTPAPITPGLTHSPGWRRRRGAGEAAACLWSEGAEPHAEEGEGGGDGGRPGEEAAGGGCGGSTEGGEEAAAPHLGT